MNRITEFLRQFTAIRVVALAAMSLMAVFFNDLLDITYKLWWVGDAMNDAACNLLYGVFSRHYSVDYGRTSAFFYAAIVMLGLVYPLYRRSDHLGKPKYFLAGIISSCALASIYLIMQKVAENESGWYGSKFYLYTLLPPTAIALFGYMVVLLWRATKPTIETLSDPSGHTIPWHTVVARKLTALCKGKAADTSWKTVVCPDEVGF